MKSRILLWAGVAALVPGTPALAQQSVEERVSGMEKRIQQLEQRAADQAKVIVEKDRQISELKVRTEWAQGVEIGATIEVQGVHEKAAGEDSTGRLEFKTVEVGIAAELNDWTSAELVLAKDDDDKIELNTATGTLGPRDGPLSLTVGKLTLPFGTFETGLISDPVTLEFAETRDTAFVFGLSSGGLSASLFGLHAESEKFENFGASAGYSLETETWPSALNVNVSYINEILSDAVADSAFSELPGMAASVMVGAGPVSLTGEYVRAMDELDGSRPAAWMVEAGFEFELLGKGAAVAAGYQATRDAADLELPEGRMLVGVSVELMDGVGFSMEWKQDEAYDTDDKDTAVTGVIALEF